MTMAVVFWVLMIIWFIFGLYANYSAGPYGFIGNAVLLFVLFGLLGWHVFGAPIHG
jgi:hypothetical protein